MRIWYDACTGKHIRYGTAIAKRLRKLGHEVILTTREHPDTLSLAGILKEKFIPVGKYDPTSLLTRLKESSHRQLLFCNKFEQERPGLAISHGSVELSRVAYGLGIPNISTYDTVYAEAVNKLTLPLIDLLIVSKAIPKRIVERCGVKKVHWFDGVDEVAWVKDFKPEAKHDYPRPLIVVRELEAKASYTRGETPLTEALIKRLDSLGNVLYLPRHPKFGSLNVGLSIPKGFVNSLSLVSEADLVIGVGGTISREAALQGTPAIVVRHFKEQYVNQYLADRGFPIHFVGIDELLKASKKLLGERKNVDNLLRELANPVDIIEGIVKSDVIRRE